MTKIINFLEAKQLLEANKAKEEEKSKALERVDSLRRNENFNHAFYELVDLFMREHYPDYAWRFDVWLERIKPAKSKLDQFIAICNDCNYMIAKYDELETPENHAKLSQFDEVAFSREITDENLQEISLFFKHLEKQKAAIEAQKQFADFKELEEQLLRSDFHPFNLNK